MPDIQIKLGDVLGPLQHLSMLDGGIAREVFVQMFKVRQVPPDLLVLVSAVIDGRAEAQSIGPVGVRHIPAMI